MNPHIGHLESVVRVLIGLPMSVAYFYMRHYDPSIAYLLLAAGLALLTAGMEYELRTPGTAERGSK
jgi:hypothetical protein